MAEYPEHEKLGAVEVERRAVTEFMEWLDAEGLFVGRWVGGVGCAESRNAHRLLANYLGIDEDRLELERRAILEKLRAKNRKEPSDG